MQSDRQHDGHTDRQHESQADRHSYKHCRQSNMDLPYDFPSHQSTIIQGILLHVAYIECISGWSALLLLYIALYTFVYII